MKTKVISVSDHKVVETLSKMVANKTLVRQFLMNKISSEELNVLGIKFARPL